MANGINVGQLYAGYTQHTTHAGKPVRLTSSGVVLATPGLLIAFYVSATTSGTLIIYDNASGATTPISGTMTPAIGYNAFPSIHQNGIYVAIGGTLDVTFFVTS